MRNIESGALALRLLLSSPCFETGELYHQWQ